MITLRSCFSRHDAMVRNKMDATARNKLTAKAWPKIATDYDWIMGRWFGIAKRIPQALWATGGWVSRSESKTAGPLGDRWFGIAKRIKDKPSGRQVVWYREANQRQVVELRTKKPRCRTGAFKAAPPCCALLMSEMKFSSTSFDFSAISTCVTKWSSHLESSSAAFSLYSSSFA